MSTVPSFGTKFRAVHYSKTIRDLIELHVRFNLPTCDANKHNLEEQERLYHSVRGAVSCDSVGEKARPNEQLNFENSLREG